MINIRTGVFETNSSSTHSLILCMKDEYNDWKNGKLFLNQSYRKEFREAKKFITKENVIKLLKDTEKYKDVDFDSMSEAALEQVFRNENIYTVESFDEENEYLEWFEEMCTTPAGEDVVAFGVFGYDG